MVRACSLAACTAAYVSRVIVRNSIPTICTQRCVDVQQKDLRSPFPIRRMAQEFAIAFGGNITGLDKWPRDSEKKPSGLNNFTEL